MLYLFGRLALSDSFYFAHDAQFDEPFDKQPAARQAADHSEPTAHAAGTVAAAPRPLPGPQPAPAAESR